MATKTATFAVELKDETSGAANAAAASLVNLKGKIQDDTKALREMQRAQRTLKAGQQSGSGAAKELADKIDAQKVSVASAQAKFVELGGVFGSTVTPKIAGTSSAFGEMTGALEKAGGPIAGVGTKVQKLGALLVSPIGLLGALAAAFLAVSAAIGVATIALLKWGVASSNARRAEALQIEGLNTIRRGWGLAAASVSEFQAAIDRASDSTNVGRGTLQNYARSLSRAGLRGDALTEAVEAMGIAAMVQGDRGANRFRALAINARIAGGSVTDLAAAYRRRLGPIARRQMLSLDNQTERLRRSMDRLFDGLDLEGALSGLDDVLSLFSQTTVTGRALKTIVDRVFQPMIDQVDVLGPLVKGFFQGVVIGALLLTIVFLRVRNALRDAFAGSELLSDLDTMKIAVGLGTAAFAAMALVVVLLGGAFAVLAVGAGIFLATVTAIPVAVIALGATIISMIVDAVKFWSDFDFSALGTSMIDGIIEGLTTGRLANAVFDLANGVGDAFKSALGIASPSRVFAAYGKNITAGLSVGIDAGAPSVEDSVGGLVDVPQGGGLGSSTSISIGDVSVNAGEISNPRELAIAFRDELAAALEGVGIEMGTA